MVASEEIVDVAVVAWGDGRIKFVPNDRTSINTAIKDFKDTTASDFKEDPLAQKTGGGVVVIRMRSRDWHRMTKEFNPYE